MQPSTENSIDAHCGEILINEHGTLVKRESNDTIPLEEQKTITTQNAIVKMTGMEKLREEIALKKKNRFHSIAS